MECEDAGSESAFAEDNSSVRVALRIRPCLPRELIEGCKTCTTVAEGHPQVWIGSNHAFTYDYVFDQDSPQQPVFETVVQQLIDGCLHGYNATILAYGQTGSGKTYTMGTGFEYDPSVDAQGIIPRAVTYLFGQIDKLRKEKSKDKADFAVQVNFVELYNEEVVDLLNQSSLRPSSAVVSCPSRPGTASAGSIRIHEDSNGSIYLVGVQTVPVTSCHETLGILREGALSRTTASTNMNDTSSRSHAIFTMHVTQTRLSNDFGETGTETLSAKFHFVDLAGSERLKRTLATGDRQKEGISINCGLLALGNVISALGDKNRKSSHVPYRDSKLTRLLQDSLGGNSRTVMIACVSPSDRDFVETLNTLKYANRARNIKNRVQINQDKSSRTISSLRRQIEHLETELLEYKQGKRVGNDSMEYKDTYQENMLLLAEAESLKSRLKSKQESIDKLTAAIAGQKTEEELRNLSSSPNADCDLTNMIQKYIMEIEDLRTKLYEAEQECQKLRTKQRQLNTSLSSPRKQLFTDLVPTPNTDVLEDARADVQNDKKRLEQLSAKERDGDDSGESDSDSEDQEKMEEIVQLSSEISVKERLIEELERSQKHMENMKRHYEEKLDCLFAKMKATEQERDKVLGTLTNGKRSAQVNADYEKKLANMQGEIKRWQNLQKEHAVASKNHASTTRQLDRLRSEVDNLKQTKVKLLKQAKIDSARFRDMEMKRQKEIMSLKKAQRMKDIKLKTLENEKIMKDQVLRRKHEEVNSLKRINKLQMSRKAQGKARPVGSPIKAKSRWSSLQHEIRKSVTIKTTVASLEREMLNLIQERTEARKRLADLENVIMKDDLIDEDIESVKGNLNFLEDRISEIQNQIAEISAGIKEVDGTEFDHEEMQYMFKKVFDMNLMNLTDLERSERRVDDLEESVKQQNKEISSLRDLLHHMINRQRAIHDDEDDVPELPPPTAVDFQSASTSGDTPSNSSKLRKARRLTSTPQELLGSLENVSTKTEFLHPNDVNLGSFLRGTRQTQSLRIPTVNKRRPQLIRQDTYNVADKRFHVLDPPEKLQSEIYRNGHNQNHHDTFNTTFLIEKSPPAPAPSASASLSKLTNSPAETNLCDNFTNLLNIDSKGLIRRVSNGVKDRVLNLTHTAEGHTKPVISMFATDDKLFTGSKDGTAKEFDLTSGVELATYSGHPNNVQCVQYLVGEETLVTASSYIVKLWDIRTGACQKNLTSSGSAVDKISYDSRLLPQGEHQIQSVAVLRNYLYTTFDNRIRVWDRRKLSSSLGIIAGKHLSNIMCLAAAENVQINGDFSDVIVSGSKDHYIKLYLINPDQSLETIQPRKNLNPPHYDGIEALLIKGTEVYSGSRDTCIKRWDMTEAKMICCSSNAHAGWITGLSNLPDRSLDYIMSSSRDGSVKIWDKDLKEVLKVDVGNFGQNNQQQSSNFSVESLCVNSRLVFTAGGSTSNSNNGATNGLVRDYGVGCWQFKDKWYVDSRNNNQQLTP